MRGFQKPEAGHRPIDIHLVLALHGRPPSHEVLEPLETLADSGHPVIFYDQLGCGRSDRPEDPAYQEAEKVLRLRPICRLDPWSEYFDRALLHPPVGRVNTEGWDIRERLNEIHVPTLVTCGEYDFCTPSQAETIHNGVRNSELVIFEGTSHYTYAEDPDKYLAVINDFLSRTEQQNLEED